MRSIDTTTRRDRSVYRALAAILFVVGAAGALPACSADTCAADDFECITLHMRFYGADGEEIQATPIAVSAIRPRPAGEKAPRFTNELGPLSFPDRSTYAEVKLGFVDPLGASPGLGCFGIPRGSSPPGCIGAGCGGSAPPTTAVAIPPVEDGLTEGTLHLQLGMDYEPLDGETHELDVVVFPASPAEGTDAPAGEVSPDTLAFGEPVVAPVTVEAEADGSTSGGSSGCGWDCSFAGLSNASLREGCCASGCPSSCSDACGNGWYEVGGQLFGPCSTQDTGCMQGAADGAVHACGF